MTVFDDAEAVYGVTPMQEAMLLYSSAGAAGTFVGQLTCRLVGPLDTEALRRAFDALLARHPALRTAFASEGLEAPLQVVKASVALPFQVLDWSTLTPEESAEREKTFLVRDLNDRFAPDTAPLMRVSLLKLSHDEHLMVWTRHHILMDGWSMALAIDELAALYLAEKNGAAADLGQPRPFQDYVEWLDRRDTAADTAFWRQHLEPADRATPMVGTGPVRDGPDDPLPDASLIEHARILSPELAASLKRTARDKGLTEAVLLTAAWALVVARYTNEDCALFGLTASGRPSDLPGVETAVGLFLNTVPLAVAVPPELELGTWLEQIAEASSAVNDHAHITMPELRALSSIPADQPMFDHILVLEGTSLAGSVDTFADLAVRDYRFIDQTNFALNVGVQLGDPPTLLVVHDPNRLSSDHARALGDAFETAIEIITGAPATGDPARRLGTIDVVGAAYKAFLSVTVNATERSFEPSATLLERIAAQHPSAIALSSEDGTVTYETLWAASGALALDIAAIAGGGSEKMVALVLERGPFLPLAVLATMRAGAVYLPINPEDSPSRIADLITESGASVVLTSDASRSAGKLDRVTVETLTLDASIWDRKPASAPDLPPCEPDGAAYAIFTSGSTGRPKAVVNTWKGLRNRIDWMQQAYPIGPNVRVLHKTPSTFDVSVWELVWPLTEGATMVIAAPEGHRDPYYLRDLIISERVDLCHFVPSMLREFLTIPGIDRCTSLKHVICSGEALTGSDRDRFHGHLDAALHNLYGPAEAAIDVSFHDCSRGERWSSVPIGMPIANTRLHLLDRHQLPVPEGATGEIFIAGDNLARGYLANAPATAERFLPDPFSSLPGARMYRTGDLARREADGSLVYLGRSDFQIKLRGMRIELGEIEAALAEVDGIGDAAVTLSQSAERGTELIAHIAPASGADFGIEQLRAAARSHLQARLPEAMVPSAFVFHDGLPVSSNGKLDRKALSTRGLGSRDGLIGNGPARESRHVAPRTEEERLIADIWSEVLGIEDIGVTQDFFELGGHSLLLVRVATRLQQTFEIELSLRALFNARTVEAMLDFVLEAELAGLDADERAAFFDAMETADPGAED
jgi:amino acid adenylation domain-containing protein